MTFAKILVPLDGSRVAEAALPRAEELLRGHPEATLLLLRAVEAKVFPGVDPIDAQVSVVHEAEDYLERVAERLRARRFDAAAVFTVYSQNPQPAAMLCYMAGIPRRLAHSREPAYGLLTHRVDEPEPQTLAR